MADTYIDPWETQSYGSFARDQMKAVCLGMIEPLDLMVRFAIREQADADKAMKQELDRQPVHVKPDGDPVADAADLLVRFGSYLDSVKGRPVPPSVFFGRDTASVAARRRLSKLTALCGEIVEELPKHKSKLRQHADWIAEFSEVHGRLQALQKSLQRSRVEAALLRPELAAAREEWLRVYTANKALITGLLRHAGKLELLPLIFDDLAEIHRAKGVSDDVPSGGRVTPPVTPVPAPTG